MLRFYSYDGVTNYIKCGTGGLQGDSPEFMVFFLVTIHLWGRIFGKFPVTKGLVYPEDPRQGTHDSTRIQSCETFPRQRSRPSGNFRWFLTRYVQGRRYWSTWVISQNMSLLMTGWHVDRTLVNDILRKGTRGLYEHWSPHDIDLTSHIHGIVGSLPPSEQTIWLPHQNVQDPLLLTPLTRLYSVNTHNRELPQEGESRPVLSPTQRSLSRQIMKAWAPWSEVIVPPRIQGCLRN